MNTASNIPHGYRSSPIGIIPKEWKVKRLGEVAPLQRGFDLPASKIQEGQYPVVYSNGILAYHNEYKVCGPGVVTGRSGTIGKVTYVDSKYYWPHNTSLWVTNFNNNLPLFIYYLYSYIDISRFSSGSGVPTLNRNDVHRMRIPLPPIDEQRRIADVLQTCDKAVESQTALVQQLEQRKHALMQQLLSARTRLPGFSDKWETKRLGEITKEREECNYTHLPLLSITSDKGVIYQTNSEKKDTSNEDKSKYKRICPNDIGYNTMRLWQGRSALSHIEGIVSPAYTIVIPLQDMVIPYYLSSLMQQQRIIYDFWTHSQGLVSDTLNCKYPDFASLTINLPSLPEQQAIADILSEADKQISLANDKLSALKQQKQALMQQLLTGKKRI